MAEQERVAELVAELTALHVQMLERDAVFARCEEELHRRDAELSTLRSQLADAGAHIEQLTAEIDAMKATRVWRLGERYWRFRDRAKISPTRRS
jgi:chromosome segregation ATPase